MKGFIKLILIFSITTIVNLHAIAQQNLKPIEKMTLDKAIKIALENSPYLKAVEHEKNAAKTYEKEAKSYRLPQVNLNEIVMRTNNPMETFALSLSQENFNLMDLMVNDPNHPSPLNDSITQLQIVQPLYMGGKITHGIKAGQKMAKAGEKKFERAKQEVIFNTKTAYLNVLLAKKYVELMDEVVKTVKTHVDMAQAYYDTGFIMEADLLQAKVFLGDVEQKKITAENNYKLAKAYFNNVIGVDQNKDFEFVNQFKFEDKEYNLDKLLTEAIENRPDYKELKLKVDAAKHNISIEKSEYKPKLFLIGELNYHDKQFLGTDGDSFKIMAVAKFNLFNGFKTKNRVLRAKEQYNSYSKYLKQMEEGIYLQVKQAYFNLNEAKKRYKVAELSEKQAKENLKLREERYKKGVEKTTDLLDADTQYIQAKTQKLHALFDYLKAEEKLKFMIGKIN
ncbi:RND family efflux pump outer membrane protein [Thermotomaculum hydrothermale]|uniref:RND family efflux pump outer membrane protein n=1 Tax=Thermotomaculum hydrothermale TaxID=981385 RepID=A0A7R6PNS1_9BACT|nr:TolC family protein [Thermotomaculum hydrothermale]BBB32496.1 RND family efflux pump outer membrane protein [Thermotomaculum hydrothermale]